MSASEYLYLSPTGEYAKFNKLFLGKKEIYALADFLLPRLEQEKTDWAEAIECQWYLGALFIDGCPKEAYMTLYGWIMQACEENEILHECKEELQAALQADERFQAA